MKRILVTGAGGPAGVNFIKSIRLTPEKFFVAASDINRYYLELPDADVRYLVLPCNHPRYIDLLNKIIELEGIEFVHPQPDVEVRAISENRERLNAKTFLPKKESISICQDKRTSAEVWEKKGIPVAKTMSIDEEEDVKEAAKSLGLPFWIRATTGAGGR
ncbi:MAG: ATP-binding protein [Candidatus Methanomethylicaceae archaeon]